MWEERWILFVSAADLARLVEGLLFILFDVLVGGGWEERQTLFVSADLAQLVEGLLFIFVWCFGGCPCVWCVLFLCRRCCCYLAGRACRTLIVDVLVLMVLCCNALIRWTLLFDVSSIVMGLPNNWCPWHLKAIYCVRAGHSLFIVNVLTKTVLCCHVLICRCRTLLFDCILDSDGVAKPLTSLVP